MNLKQVHLSSPSCASKVHVYLFVDHIWPSPDYKAKKKIIIVIITIGSMFSSLLYSQRLTLRPAHTSCSLNVH